VALEGIEGHDKGLGRLGAGEGETWDATRIQVAPPGGAVLSAILLVTSMSTLSVYSGTGAILAARTVALRRGVRALAVR
jgi:hypothetical protein